MKRFGKLVPLLFLIALSAAAVRAADADPSGIEYFESRIRPLFAAHCYQCHSTTSEKLKGGLHLDSSAGLLAGGETGAVLSPGAPDKSRLIIAVRYQNPDLQMPPKGKLPDGDIATLVKWVQLGAPMPNATGTPVRPEKVFDLQHRRDTHWCWQPIRAAEPPAVHDRDWPASPIDRFILAKLEEKQLTPAAPADKRTLIRRAYFDLIGLPPEPADVQAFVNDNAPDAFEHVVDRLLASGHFGERWARHWLDLVRYAESYGHESDFPIDDAEEYVRYVVRALNADLPYDQFMTEQIAGDLLSKPRLHPTEGFNESIIGSGFWFFGEQTHSPVDVRQQQADRIDNQIEVFSKTFLGLTANCARCHDHKFDAISAKDYYALFGILESTRLQHAYLDPKGAIASAVKVISESRAEESRLLLREVPDSKTAGQRLAAYLRAARSAVLPSAPAGIPSKDANPQTIDPQILKRVVAGLGDAAKQPAQPMHVWSVLGMMPGGDCKTFAAERDRLLDAAKQSIDARRKITPFETFDDGTFANWYPAGDAFGDGPTHGGQLDPGGNPRFAQPGVADTRTLDRRLRGVLRSRSFVLQSPRIFYRIAGQGAKVRVVVDGYEMDPFTSLLFEGLTFNVDTGDTPPQWREQSVERYVGHRAHIELIDDGDGWIAVDEIGFGTRDPIPEAALFERTIAAAADSPPVDSQSLADAYGKTLATALDGLRRGVADELQTNLVNWCLQTGILVDEQAAKEIRSQLDVLRRRAQAVPIPAPMRAVAAADGNGVDECVFIRGSHKTPGEQVPRRFLEALAGSAQPEFPRQQSGRLELAHDVCDSSNPLPARVMVNRVWHHLFGRGIVATTDDFGVMGQRPTHPELLDYLATEFVKTDRWSLKKLIRSIVLTRAYQLSSVPSDRALEVDPGNDLLQHARVRRLEGEAIRDAILAVSGRLDRTIDGPFIDVYLTPFVQSSVKPPPSGPLDGAGRRSLYLKMRRNFLSPMMLAFDAPTPFSAIGRRNVSNVPAQALILLNDPFVIEQCQRWAQKALSEGGLTTEQRIQRMYTTAFARLPDDRELAASVAFINAQGDSLGLNPEAAASDARVWSDFAHVLVNVKEFIFLN